MTFSPFTFPVALFGYDPPLPRALSVREYSHAEAQDGLACLYADSHSRVVVRLQLQHVDAPRTRASSTGECSVWGGGVTM